MGFYSKIKSTYLIIFFWIIVNLTDLPSNILHKGQVILISSTVFLIAYFLVRILKTFIQNEYKVYMILTSFFCIMLLTIPIHTTLNAIFPFTFVRVRYSFSFTLIVWSVFSCMVFFDKRILKKVEDYFKMTFSLLSLIQICTCTNIHYKQESHRATLLNTKNYADTTVPYNIFLIVPDGYATNINLKKYWNYDNTTFTNYLKAKGFFFVENAKTKFKYSRQTIGSIFNLDEIELPINRITFLENTLRWGNLISFLHKLNYKINTWDYMGKKFEDNQGYFTGLTENTFFNVFDRTRKLPSTDEKFTYLDKIMQLPDTKKFCYVHTLSTHAPFEKEDKQIIALEDKIRSGITLTDSGYALLEHNYLESLLNVNRKLETLLDANWEKINANSIIIIMADHGYRNLSPLKEGSKEECFNNFCAVYFPEKNYQILEQKDSISPAFLLKKTLDNIFINESIIGSF